VSIDLRLLRYFVATADAGSATRAATELHVTQPVLSRQLRQLEQQLGLRLFERDGRRLRLTAAAEDFLTEARALLSHAEQVERAADALASGRLSALHLAAPTTTLTDVLAPFVATLGADDPMPMVRELDPRGTVAALRGGADLAVVTRPPTRAVASRALAVLPVWAYVAGDDDWAQRDSVHVSELATRRLVLLTSDFRPRALLDAAMDDAGVGYGDHVEVANAQVAQAVAAAGRGVAVVSDDPRFGLVPLRIDGPGGPVRIRLYAAWDPGHHAARTLADLARRLAAFCVERYGPEVAP
jgi:DNA-binding transcriptional LysR family regulator